MSQELQVIGRLNKPHGLHGFIKAELEVDILENKNFPKHLFIKEGSQVLPFFVEETRFEQGVLSALKFEGIDDRTSAEKYRSTQIFTDTFDEFFSHRLDWSQYIGLVVIDQEHGEIGTVEDILELPAQHTLQIRSKGGEILIPIVKNTIIELDKTKETLLIQSPSGLIDLYLNG